MVVFVAMFLAASVAPSEPVYAKNSYKQNKPKKYRPKKYHPKKYRPNKAHSSKRNRSRNEPVGGQFESCSSYEGCISRKSTQNGNSRRIINNPSFSVSY